MPSSRLQEAHEKVRHLSFVLGAGSALIGISAAMLAGFWAAVPFLVLAILATTASILYWQRMEGARKDEERALASTPGASSYLAFQINRVNGLLTNDHARRQMMRAAEDHTRRSGPSGESWGWYPHQLGLRAGPGSPQAEEVGGPGHHRGLHPMAAPA